ncbi:MAG TPA: energy-coupling factor ABC transporter permease [Pantanalinema sp.]
MSHLHLPDGILPLWLVLAGWSVTLLLLFFSLRRARGPGGRAALPRLGFLSALMVVAMSAEILPLPYHLDLSVVAGILLGPSAGFLAAFIVDLVLALLGHGGLTVIGLNAPILAIEVVLGSILFRAMRRRGISSVLAAAATTALVLPLSTGAMVAVVWLARIDPARLHEGLAPPDFSLFLAITYGLGSIGWLLEATVTAGIVRYLARVRPGLIEEA